MDALRDALFQSGAQRRDLQDLRNVAIPPEMLAEALGNMAKGAGAGLAGMPVDLATTVMRPFGYDVPPQDVVGSSEWIGERMGADSESGAFLAGQFASPDPLDAARLANHAPEMQHLIEAMTVFHGSPHKWDKVDLSKVGTGEGAQAYGHGFYAAENPDVANSYKKALSKARHSTSLTDDVEMLEVNGKRLLDDFAIEADRDFVSLINDQDKVVATRHAKSRIARWKELAKDPEYEFQDYAAEKADAWERLLPHVEAGKVDNPGLGQMYELDLPDETIGKMLDWDKPLSEQPEGVRKALGKMVTDHDHWKLYEETVPPKAASIAKKMILGELPSTGPTSDKYWDALDGLAPDVDHNLIHDLRSMIGIDEQQTGEGLYRALTNRAENGQQDASRTLHALGIPGIKYLDGTSRNAGDGTRNFVIFDEQHIKPLKRNGEAITYEP